MTELNAMSLTIVLFILAAVLFITIAIQRRKRQSNPANVSDAKTKEGKSVD